MILYSGNQSRIFDFYLCSKRSSDFSLVFCIEAIRLSSREIELAHQFQKLSDTISVLLRGNTFDKIMTPSLLHPTLLFNLDMITNLEGKLQIQRSCIWVKTDLVSYPTREGGFG